MGVPEVYHRRRPCTVKSDITVHNARPSKNLIYKEGLGLVKYHLTIMMYQLFTTIRTNKVTAMEVIIKANFLHAFRTIAPQDVVEVVEIVNISRASVVCERRSLLHCGVIELNTIPAFVAAALAHPEGEALQANDGKGIVDDEDEEENAQETRGQSDHCVHDVSILAFQFDQPEQQERKRT